MLCVRVTLIFVLAEDQFEELKPISPGYLRAENHELVFILTHGVHHDEDMNHGCHRREHSCTTTVKTVK